LQRHKIENEYGYSRTAKSFQQLCPSVDKGNERETFFYSQLRVAHDVKYPQQGDFLVDDRYLFEVGGRKKTYDQIADVADSFLAVDDTEVGHGHRIPLWLFGFIY
jgi:hypothetical protein